MAMSGADPTRVVAKGASARRLRYTTLTLALIAMTTLLCVAAAFIGEARRLRVDVTATRAHSLSARTQTLLDGLASPHELIVVADSARIDAAAQQRLVDLLDLLDRSSPNLAATWIDTANPADRAAFEALPERMLALREAEVAAGRKAIGDAVASAERVAQTIDELAALLGEWPGMMRDEGADQPIIEALEELAALARVRRDEVRQVASAFPLAGAARIAGIELPEVSAAQGSLGVVLPRAAESLNTVALAADQIARAQLYAPLHEQAPGAKSLAEAARDEALRAADAINLAPTVRLLDTLRLLQSQDAAVLLSESNVIAIRIESLLAQSGDGSSQAAQVRFEAERAITSALAAASASGGGSPLLVLTHSQPAPILTRPAPGQPDSAGALRGLLDHLSMQGYEIREWAASVDTTRPAFAEERAKGRPIVWIALPGTASTSDSAARMGQLAIALASLVEDGEDVLANIGPSLLPRVGESDPIVAPFESLGLTIDSGRPLVETTSTPAGPRSASMFRTLRANTDHPIGAAMDGLALALIWPSPMRIKDDAPMEWDALVTIESREDVWGESQWPTLVQAGAMNATATFDERVDARGGPWVVVAAGERFLEGRADPQRLVIVGSNGWFFDAISLQRAQAEGRIDLRNPGNLELVDASLLWLSGRDDAMASASDRGSRVRAIDPGTLRMLWALCILGPATATLLLGAALRLLRG
jgi:hypothetical protein